MDERTPAARRRRRKSPEAAVPTFWAEVFFASSALAKDTFVFLALARPRNCRSRKATSSARITSAMPKMSHASASGAEAFASAFSVCVFSSAAVSAPVSSSPPRARGAVFRPSSASEAREGPPRGTPKMPESPMRARARARARSRLLRTAAPRSRSRGPRPTPPSASASRNRALWFPRAETRARLFAAAISARRADAGNLRREALTASTHYAHYAHYAPRRSLLPDLPDLP